MFNRFNTIYSFSELFTESFALGGSVKIGDKWIDLPEGKYNKYLELKEQKQELEQHLQELFIDQENDKEHIEEIETTGSGPIAAWWGEKLNKVEQEIESINEKINKILEYKPKEFKGRSNVHSKLLKHKEDIIRSHKSYPERSIEDFAKILKKRYDISDDIPAIIQSLSALALVSA